jgi:tetratricopeptide (TPR) repeat protein
MNYRARLPDRARLEVFEARAVPYTPEELALFKPTATQLASTDPGSGRKSLKELPADARSLVLEAQRHFSAGEFDRAEAKYLEILRQDDKNAYTLANLAAIQLELNHLDEADKHVKQALACAG